MSTETPQKTESTPPAAEESPAGPKSKAQRLKDGARGLGDGFLTIARGLFSDDAPTRRMSTVFFLSLVLLAVSVSWGIQRLREHPVEKAHELTESERAAKNLSDFVAKQAAENKRRAGQIAIGTFQLETLPLPGERRIRGVMNVADIDLTLQCDDKETRDFIDSHSVEARNHIASVLNPVQRSELLSAEGKARVRKAVVDRLNGWLPKGKVLDVYITRLIAT